MGCEEEKQQIRISYIQHSSEIVGLGVVLLQLSQGHRKKTFHAWNKPERLVPDSISEAGTNTKLPKIRSQRRNGVKDCRIERRGPISSSNLICGRRRGSSHIFWIGRIGATRIDPNPPQDCGYAPNLQRVVCTLKKRLLGAGRPRLPRHGGSIAQSHEPQRDPVD